MGLLEKLKKKLSKKDETVVGTVPTVSEKSFPEVRPVGSTNDLLQEWTKTLEMVEKHPLSQARIINTGVLTDLTHVLNSMNEKLERLEKLDDIIGMLMDTKKQLGDANLPTDNIDKVIGSIKGLTIKDQEALELFKDVDSLTTKQFAKKASLSRSTASSRLNKLSSFGLLEKKAKGKKIFYQLKE